MSYDTSQNYYTHTPFLMTNSGNLRIQQFLRTVNEMCSSWKKIMYSMVLLQQPIANAVIKFGCNLKFKDNKYST